MTLIPIVITFFISQIIRKRGIKKFNFFEKVAFGLIIGLLSVASSSIHIAYSDAIDINILVPLILISAFYVSIISSLITSVCSIIFLYITMDGTYNYLSNIAEIMVTFLVIYLLTENFFSKFKENERLRINSYIFPLAIVCEMLHIVLVVFIHIRDIYISLESIKGFAILQVAITSLSVLASNQIHTFLTATPREKKEYKKTTDKALFNIFSSTLYIGLFFSTLNIAALDISLSKYINKRNYVVQQELTKGNIELKNIQEINSKYSDYFISILREKDPQILALQGKTSDLYRYSLLYVFLITSILIPVIQFLIIQHKVKKMFLNNISKINEQLDKITKGNLDLTVDIKTTTEFETLSNGINKTVNMLKSLAHESEKKMENELLTAGEIQMSSLPQTFPPYPNRNEFDIYATMKPAKEVGGDFYDFFFTKENRLFFVISDVSDKGIPAAMFMMRAKATLRNIADSGMTPANILNEANKQLYKNNNAFMFMTCWMGCLDTRTGKVFYSNAGHNPPVIKRASGKVETLDMNAGFVLGGMYTSTFAPGSVQLNEGDMIILYTDGVTESINKKDELYGMERLESICLSSNSANDLCDMIIDDVDEFATGCKQADDITILILKYNGANYVRHNFSKIKIVKTEK